MSKWCAKRVWNWNQGKQRRIPNSFIFTRPKQGPGRIIGEQGDSLKFAQLLDTWWYLGYQWLSDLSLASNCDLTLQVNFEVKHPGHSWPVKNPFCHVLPVEMPRIRCPFNGVNLLNFSLACHSSRLKKKVEPKPCAPMGSSFAGTTSAAEEFLWFLKGRKAAAWRCSFLVGASLVQKWSNIDL